MKYTIIGDNNKEDILKTLFINRGISVENINNYISASKTNLLDYDDLDNIHVAVECLIEHLNKDSNILLVVDCDVDGFTSSALFYNAIKELRPDANIDFVVHDGKMHGLSSDLDFNSDDYNLIILPDSSSNDYEQHEYLDNKSIDVIVLDHHEAEKYSEHAIVVNNQLSENYSNKALSGVGVVWQFLKCLIEDTEADFDLTKYLDLVAVGNVADMMDLTSYETRYFVANGLKNIHNKFIKQIIKENEYTLGSSGTITPKDVSWTIAPMVNAMIRVGTQKDKRLLFMAFLDEYAMTDVPSTKRGSKDGDTEVLASQAIRICRNARAKQNKTVDSGIALIEKQIKENNLEDNKLLLIEVGVNELDATLIGLIANKIAPKYFRPTIICKRINDDLVGSIRNFGYSELEDFRGELEESGLVNWAQGHASAAGVSIPYENKEKLVEYFNYKLKDLSFTKQYRVDFEFDSCEKQNIKDTILSIDGLNKSGIWGKGVEEPFVVVRNVCIDGSNLSVMKTKKSTTMKITDSTDPLIEYIKFRATDEFINNFQSGFGAKYVTFVGTCQMNEWMGNRKYQIEIVDFKIEDEVQFIF